MQVKYTSPGKLEIAAGHGMAGPLLKEIWSLASASLSQGIALGRRVKLTVADLQALVATLERSSNPKMNELARALKGALR